VLKATEGFRVGFMFIALGLPRLSTNVDGEMRIPSTNGRSPSRSDSRPPLPRSNSSAFGLGLALGAASALLLSALGGAAVPFAIISEFILPVPVCLRARSNVLTLSLVPNAVVNCWFVFIQSPRSPYWAGWRNEWGLSLAVLGFGAAASLIVSGLFLWRRNATGIS
jgi:hypothetical protein